MKEITLPSVETIVGRKDGRLALVSMSLPRFLQDNVWCHPFWRDNSEEKRQTLLRLMPKFALVPTIAEEKVSWTEDPPGTKIRIHDRDWEILCEALQFKNTNLAPESTLQTIKLSSAIFDAESVSDAPTIDPAANR